MLQSLSDLQVVLSSGVLLHRLAQLQRASWTVPMVENQLCWDPQSASLEARLEAVPQVAVQTVQEAAVKTLKLEVLSALELDPSQ